MDTVCTYCASPSELPSGGSTDNSQSPSAQSSSTRNRVIQDRSTAGPLFHTSKSWLAPRHAQSEHSTASSTGKRQMASAPRTRPEHRCRFRPATCHRRCRMHPLHRCRCSPRSRATRTPRDPPGSAPPARCRRDPCRPGPGRCCHPHPRRANLPSGGSHHLTDQPTTGRCPGCPHPVHPPCTSLYVTSGVPEYA